jgi:hypothetical protein
VVKYREFVGDQNDCILGICWEAVSIVTALWAGWCRAYMLAVTSDFPLLQNVHAGSASSAEVKNK